MDESSSSMMSNLPIEGVEIVAMGLQPVEGESWGERKTQKFEDANALSPTSRAACSSLNQRDDQNESVASMNNHRIRGKSRPTDRTQNSDPTRFSPARYPPPQPSPSQTPP